MEIDSKEAALLHSILEGKSSYFRLDLGG